MENFTVSKEMTSHSTRIKKISLRIHIMELTELVSINQSYLFRYEINLENVQRLPRYEEILLSLSNSQPAISNYKIERQIYFSRKRKY